MKPVSLLSSAKVACWLLIACASFALAGSASAQQFKVTATGRLTSVTNGLVPFNSSVAVGTPFTFSFLFDYSAPNTTPGSSTGSHGISGVNAGATASFGDYNFTPGPTSGNVIFVRHAAAHPDRLDLASDNETTPGFSVP